MRCPCARRSVAVLCAVALWLPACSSPAATSEPAAAATPRRTARGPVSPTASLTADPASPAAPATHDRATHDGAAPAAPASPATATASVPPPAPPVPFSLVVDHIEIRPLSNAGIVGHAVPPIDEQAVVGAVEGARAALQRYLDAQFVHEAARFTAAPLEALLTPGAAALLTEDGRAALGQLAAPPASADGGAAVAGAQVLVDAATVRWVALTYEAPMTLRATVRAEPAEPAVQRGTLVFVAADDGWRAQAADVTLDRSETP